MSRSRLSLLGVLVCGIVLVGASTAVASPALLVTGAGASTTSGLIQVNARATGPAIGPFIPVAPAIGFIHSAGSWGDVRGSVTCIASLGPEAAIVSGDLDMPISSGGFTFPNFSLIVVRGGNGVPPWIHFFVDNLTGLGDCAQSLIFAAGIPDLPNDVVVKGHFLVLRGADRDTGQAHAQQQDLIRA